MAIKALMVDVDGVLVKGRPSDGRPWSTSLQEDLGLSPEALHRGFFLEHWNEIVVGRAALMDRLTPALRTMAPHLSPERFVDYWFQQDARLDHELLKSLGAARATGIAVHLATNQEHRRAMYLMESLGLAKYVDGLHYSAELGVKKPDCEFFQRIVARTGFAAEDLLLADDSRENIEAAFAVGWHVFHWTSGSLPAELEAAVWAPH